MAVPPSSMDGTTQALTMQHSPARPVGVTLLLGRLASRTRRERSSRPATRVHEDLDRGRESLAARVDGRLCDAGFSAAHQLPVRHGFAPSRSMPDTIKFDIASTSSLENVAFLARPRRSQPPRSTAASLEEADLRGQSQVLLFQLHAGGRAPGHRLFPRTGPSS
jgi:hypothetical protein